jgi:hypothetical protein
MLRHTDRSSLFLLPWKQPVAEGSDMQRIHTILDNLCENITLVFRLSVSCWQHVTSSSYQICHASTMHSCSNIHFCSLAWNIGSPYHLWHRSQYWSPCRIWVCQSHWYGWHPTCSFLEGRLSPIFYQRRYKPNPGAGTHEASSRDMISSPRCNIVYSTERERIPRLQIHTPILLMWHWQRC